MDLKALVNATPMPAYSYVVDDVLDLRTVQPTMEKAAKMAAFLLQNISIPHDCGHLDCIACAYYMKSMFPQYKLVNVPVTVGATVDIPE